MEQVESDDIHGNGTSSAPHRAPDIRTIHKYADLLSQKVEHEAELRVVKAQLEQLEPFALSYFERQGITSVKLEGRTLFLRRELWPKLAEGREASEAVAVLQGTELEELAAKKLNWQSLASVCRERERNGDPAVPPILDGIIVASEQFKIGFRS